MNEKYTKGISIIIIKLTKIWYLCIFPVAPIAVHKGAERASVKDVIITNCVKTTAYLGTFTNHIERMSSQKIITGNDNIKITVKDDIIRAEAILTARGEK